MSDRWCFTVNNPEGWRPVWDAGIMLYMVWQLERGAEGTQHVQGYVRFDRRKRGSTVKRLLNRNAHVEPARGSEEQCRTYCTKEETREEAGEEYGEFDASIGTGGKQGQRTDLTTIANMIIAGSTMRDVAIAYPGDYIRYHSGFEAFQLTVTAIPPVQRDVQVIVLWGPTGTGKTHRIMTQYPECFCVRPGRDPWDGYSSQATIFLDEFDWAQWSIHEMKLILDKWRYRLQRRYRNAFAAWTLVAICCNQSPNSWWPNAHEADILAIRRRLVGSCHLVEDRDTPIAEMPVNPQY